MKNIILALLFVTAVVPAKAESPYKAGEFSVSPFASYRLHEFNKFDGKAGGGLMIDYAVLKNLTIELSTLSEGYNHGEAAVNSLDEAAANLKFYVPIGQSPFALYALLGYTVDLNNGDEDWKTVSQKECEETRVALHSRDRGDHRMNAGIGLECRYKFVKVFADAQWTSDLLTYGQVLGRVGAGVTF